MDKIKINLDVLLPDVPNERDGCVQRIISELKDTKGIDNIHVIPEKDDRKAQFCFHYDPSLISLEKVQQLAEQAGARITQRYGHLLVEVSGIRHQRQTKLIETVLQQEKGVLSVSASATGVIAIEFDTQSISAGKVYGLLEKQGLTIMNRQSAPAHQVAPLPAGDSKPGKEKHVHGEGEEHDHEHDHGGHSHGGIFGKNTELIFSLTCGALIGISYGLSFLPGITAWTPNILYIIAYFFGGYFTAKEAVQTVLKGGFEIDFLMLVAAIGAAILGSWLEGALLLFLFSLGHALEHYAMEKARKSIAALTALAPKTAFRKQDGQIQEVKIEELKVGDVVVIKPNTKISADGIVIAGNSSVNQAPITGESIPVDKTAVDNKDIDPKEAMKLDGKYRVYAGTINGNEVLEIKVSKAATDSTLSRLVKMVNEAQTQKSPTQQFTDKIERVFVPAVLILVTLLCFAFLVIDEPFGKSFYRAMAVLVAASPCALAISTPSAVLSGVARAARAGVLIKGGRPLEDLGTLTALAFDKTGTLTEGKPRLTTVQPYGDLTKAGLLKMVVAVESLSDHPIAKAIVRDGKKQLGQEAIPGAHSMEAVLGKGIKALLGNDQLYAGNLALFESLDGTKPSNEIIAALRTAEAGGQTTMLIRKNQEYVGLIGVMDTPRAEAKETLARLQEIGIKKMIMLTGDNQQVAEAIAKEIGLTDAMGSLLPEQKVAAIQQLAEQEGKVAMVGDGVNDAPAMAKSTVGIAMGAAGSDVALETADIALMGDQLSLLPFAIGLSRQSKRIITQNLVISLGMVALLIPLTILGVAPIGPAVAAHEGSTLVVVANALRLLAYKNKEQTM
ncbi:heavy metal translocating P-type ATPase [Paraflavitalea soli]|uniref:P-type Zn(2+) transporter n=1 Tax=Paraflavitalea soli TaxID=2315862 RepID=A0A3B7MXG7_9BACT|nr:heavy metal translocating P-type ATPase [Paraflavitalea soli]AXY77919.1 heavy metal translocating P-type ATPase [Paraflavitalea soli]